MGGKKRVTSVSDFIDYRKRRPINTTTTTMTILTTPTATDSKIFRNMLSCGRLSC